MANGGTASGVRQQIQDRLLRAIRQYRDAAPLADKHYFELGQSIHTIEDLYTPSHTARNRDGEITRFQSYNAQSPAYHATADVFDQNPDAFDVNAPVGDAKTPEGRARQKLVTAQATRFLQLAIAIRQDKWGDERIRGALDQFLQLAANAETGGTDENFAPKQNAVSDAIDAAKKSSAAATDWILDKWKSFAW